MCCARWRGEPHVGSVGTALRNERFMPAWHGKLHRTLPLTFRLSLLRATNDQPCIGRGLISLCANGILNPQVLARIRKFCGLADEEIGVDAALATHNWPLRQLWFDDSDELAVLLGHS